MLQDTSILYHIFQVMWMNRNRSCYIRADRSTKIRLTETMRISRSLAGTYLTKSLARSTEQTRLRDSSALSWPRRESRPVASGIRSGLRLAEIRMLSVEKCSQNFQDLTRGQAPGCDIYVERRCLTLVVTFQNQCLKQGCFSKSHTPGLSLHGQTPL